MNPRVPVLLAALLLTLAAASPALAEGKPVEPGNATADQFLPATGCGCHSARVDEWNASLHAQALVDPIFLTKVAEGNAATDGEIGAFCNKCHGPVATMTGEMGGTLSPVSAEAVTCMFCHQAVGNEGDPANVSQLVVADGTRRAQIKDPAAPHPAVFSEFHGSAEICGGCHNVIHPGTATHLESTYLEWSEGPYASEGIVCQDCHMSQTPGEVGGFSGEACAGGAERDPIFRMSFVGANRILGPADGGEALLKSAAEIDVAVPEIVAPGTETSVSVTVLNKGAGHYLPTGLTEVRQMWLAVWAEDAAGVKTDLGEVRYETILKDEKGDYPAEMWEANGIQSDHRIPPKGSVTESFTFAMPQDAEQAKIVAALYYKSVPDELAEKAGVENVTTEMALASSEVFASEGAKSAAPEEPAAGQESPSWLVPVVGAVVVIGVAALAWTYLRKRKQGPAS